MNELIIGQKPQKLTETSGFRGHDGTPFDKYHRAKDPVMVPDKGFTKQLKKIDPDLEVQWDWVNEIWTIWCVPEDGRKAYQVTEVCTKGRTYRELGQDILLKIQESVSFTADPDKLIDYIEEHNNQIRRRKAKEFKDHVRQIAKETFNYTHGILQIQVPRNEFIKEALK